MRPATSLTAGCATLDATWSPASLELQFSSIDGCNWNDVLHTLGAHVGLLMVGNGGRLPLIVSRVCAGIA